MTTTYTHRTLTRNERIAIAHAVSTDNFIALNVCDLASAELRDHLEGMILMSGVIETEGLLVCFHYEPYAIRVEDVDALVAEYERAAS